MGFGATELILLLVVVLIVFGAGKLPKVMSDMGKGIKSFKQGMKEVEADTAISDDKKE